jgi:hypothetical protein
MIRRATPTFALALVAAASGLLAGCSLAGNEFLPGYMDAQSLNGRDGASSDDGGFDAAGIDATIDSPSTAAFQGNPLCHASRAIGACYPDDPITPMTATACNTDGGANDAGGGLGCHVSPNGSLPVCLAAGPGMDGDHCASSTDCAAGLECVASGTCRPYCCTGPGKCAAGGDAGGPGEFCDIQQVAGPTDTKVPVCMPIQSCSLLAQLTQVDAGASQCGAGQTCAVVRGDDGATSCVAIGKAMAGDPCDTEHCAAGLVCLGISQRKCYELCLTQATATAPLSACPAGLTCQGGLPLFPNPAVGICDTKP